MAGAVRMPLCARCSMVVLFVLLFWRTVHAFPPLASDCDIQCDPDQEESGPVCGNDGRTYGSRCEIERIRCQGLPVMVQHEGKCASERNRCAAQRALLLSQGDDRSTLFVPECHEDGSYAEVQCHVSTGYCWCVDRMGKPIRGSSIQNERPVCASHNGKGKRTNKRRSSRGRKNKKGCGTNDRAKFNNNLIEIFESEYNRVDHPNDEEFAETGTADPLRDTHEKRVVQWKFDQLDSDGDAALMKPEYKDLKRMAKRIVRPKGCARTFAKFCDLDQDKKISRAEWAVCVGVDINNEQVERLEDFLDDQPPKEGVPLKPEIESSSKPWDRESHGTRLYQMKPENSEDEEDISKEEVEALDCTSARMTAIDTNQKFPDSRNHVPECTATGDWVRAQCHESPTYCWCVHPRTGKPIRGTTTQGVKPDCESVKTKTKKFKGCPLHKKQEFLDEMIKSFSKEMLEDALNRSVKIDTPTPEKAARWKFSNTDTNSNGMLDKREWKIFKMERRTLQKESKLKPRLRKCWRNLPRFCDENDNQKITMDEWLACTVTTRDSKSNLPRNKKRGNSPNPFSTILKSD